MLDTMPPYTIPLAYFPAASNLPQGEQFPMLVQTSMRLCISAGNMVVIQLRNSVHSPLQLQVALAPLGDRLTTLQQLLLPTAQLLRERAKAGTDADAQQTAAQDMNAVMAEACRIYDNYFQVVRLFPVTHLEFTAQVVDTCLHLLLDLPYTLLDRTQLIMLLSTMHQLFCVLAATEPASTSVFDAANANFNATGVNLDGACTNDGHSPATDKTSNAQAERWRAIYADLWQYAPTLEADWTKKIAQYRWTVGHHFFNLCTVFCRHALVEAQHAIAHDQQGESVRRLANAEHFLRGTTAAMWYAADFPMAVYQEIIRPSMIMPGAPAGFSGDQNADYNRMKDAKQHLKEGLRAQYGLTLAAIPEELWGALMSFHEADVQDVEHHLLIAANKVGIDQSLAQKNWLSELPDTPHIPAAIDILREMAELRRREFLS